MRPPDPHTRDLTAVLHCALRAWEASAQSSPSPSPPHGAGRAFLMAELLSPSPPLPLCLCLLPPNNTFFFDLCFLSSPMADKYTEGKVQGRTSEASFRLHASASLPCGERRATTLLSQVQVYMRLQGQRAPGSRQKRQGILFRSTDSRARPCGLGFWLSHASWVALGTIFQLPQFLHLSNKARGIIIVSFTLL